MAKLRELQRRARSSARNPGAEASAGYHPADASEPARGGRLASGSPCASTAAASSASAGYHPAAASTAAAAAAAAIAMALQEEDAEQAAL